MTPAEAALAARPAMFGDYPVRKHDIAGSVVCIVCFLVLAVVNMTMLRRNLARGHKFIPSGAMFGLCMARIITFSMRLAYTTHPTNINISIAANIFLAAGVVILFILNILFSQRVFTSRHPSLAYVGSLFYTVMRAFYISVIVFLIVLIVTTGVYYHTNHTVQQGISQFRKVAMVYFVVSAFLPIPIVAAAYWIPRSEKDETWPVHYAHWIERYSGLYSPDPRRKPSAAEFYAEIPQGETRRPVHVIPPPERGARQVSVALILIAAVILTFATAVRTASSFVVVSLLEKPWYDYRVTMYLCIALAELLVEIMWIVGRVDLKFYIPDNKWDKSASSTDSDKDGVMDLEVDGETEVELDGARRAGDAGALEKQL
ncbi:hypothetical protein POJ06DRAFT_257633 [Lipomyces tetrasporus]|uniref:Uncharacterized protein n=1 Tax=Lipomyces tetrasporus TaxID=54092 RepID=A0AAD7QRW0_9ASCO|nr:uncharacterized protein POJ06DRAFT_257633 [Lipomyces tetrasporus]KAJ8098657.1 hypothetical protein POJ06DRAFT_257633 [Lipomyces tetrasporus]